VVREFPAPRSAAWEENARAWLTNPGEPLIPRGAAPVLLVRDTAGGPSVFVQRRVATMEFAPSMYVFPGGGVDPEDATTVIDDRTVAALAGRMGLNPEEALPLIAAGVREVEEECGVRLDPSRLSPRAHWVTPPFEKRRYDTWFFAAELPDGQSPRGATGESDRDAWVLPGGLLTA